MRRLLQFASRLSVNAVFLLALIFEGLAAMPACAQVVAGTSYENSSGSAALTGSVTMTSVDANSVVIVSVALDDTGTAGTISVPTATGLTFVQIGSTLRTSMEFRLAVFRAWTTSARGSTVITCTWTQSTAWDIGATDFTGTAGTAANNGSDAIGTTNTATGASTTQTVTVNSSSHNNSKYLGVVGYNNGTITKGANYTNCVPNTNNTVLSLLTEISTNPVSPAANTAVNSTATNAGDDHYGIFGIELLVATATAACTPSLPLLGVGRCG